MATPPSEVRGGLEVISTAATAQLVAATADLPPDETPGVLYALLPLLIPAHFDAAGGLASFWYEELRDESNPTGIYAPEIVSQGNAAWIEIELRKAYEEALREIDGDIQAAAASLVAEAEALTQKEVARGFRDTIDGNTKRDPEAIGWSRHARPGACKFCLFAARDSAVYRSEKSARFAPHTNCHCVARPEFANGTHGPEASALQYLGQQRARTDEERAKLREYLNRKYPDAPG